MIYHITTKSNWDKAIANGAFDTESLYTEGFIHSSKKEQVAGVLERYYKNVTDLLMLHIDESKLTSPLRYELAPSINESFPHIYGKLNIDAVVEVESI